MAAVARNLRARPWAARGCDPTTMLTELPATPSTWLRPRASSRADPAFRHRPSELRATGRRRISRTPATRADGHGLAARRARLHAAAERAGAIGTGSGPRHGGRESGECRPAATTWTALPRFSELNAGLHGMRSWRVHRSSASLSSPDRSCPNITATVTVFPAAVASACSVASSSPISRAARIGTEISRRRALVPTTTTQSATASATESKDFARSSTSCAPEARAIAGPSR